MANLRSSTSSRRQKHLSSVVLLLSLILVQSEVSCYQYKVGDLDAWGLPASASEQVYDKWSKLHTFSIGDSLLFLYPPSEDSLIQVTEEAYNNCNLKDPILSMDDGNSLFNITSLGAFFFTSGVSGHCEKDQKLRIAVGNVSSSPGPSSLPDISPSYPTVFGSIPQGPSSSSSPPLSSSKLMVSAAVAVGFAVHTVVRGLF